MGTERGGGEGQMEMITRINGYLSEGVNCFRYLYI